MKRFKNILAVYSDAIGHDDVLTQASALAKRNDARLTVIEVIEERGASRAHVAERQKHLSRIAESIRQTGIKVKSVVCVGTPFLEIIRQVLRSRNDLVIMVADGGSGFKSLFFGSTSMHLMRKCPCPAWIVNPGKEPTYARILAAVDLGPDDTGVNELNVKIMDLATSLAQLNQSALHVVHVWEFVGNELDSIRSELPRELREQLLRRNELLHREALQHFLQRYSLEALPHHVHVVRGEPERLLPKIAEEEKIDLLVMGTLGRTGIPGVFIGSTAESVLRQVECAVMTVKAEGFVTPVTLEE